MNWRYKLISPKTGEVLYEGTPAELVEQGVYKTEAGICASYLRQQRGRKPVRWKIERENVTATVVVQRKLPVYKCWAADGRLLAEGTGQELAQKGFFPQRQTASQLYRRKKAYGDVAYITQELQPRPVQCWSEAAQEKREQKPEPKKEPPKENAAGRVPKCPDPTPLQRDVHDLIVYNAAAKKLHRRELSYGYWAAAGKPEEP